MPIPTRSYHPQSSTVAPHTYPTVKTSLNTSSHYGPCHELTIVYGDPNQALFFGGMGIVAALVFGNLGAAYGTAKSGVGICSVAVLKPELIIKSIIPVVMAGILGIYGLIISVIISGSCK